MSPIKSLGVAALLAGTLLAGSATAQTLTTICTSYRHQISCRTTDGLTSYQRAMWWYNRKMQADSAWERRENRKNHEYTGE